MVGEDLCFWPSPHFWQTIGLNLSEDLFFFWSSANFGRKIGLILGETIFVLIFVHLKFSEVSVPPPPFQNPAYATDKRYTNTKP